MANSPSPRPRDQRNPSQPPGPAGQDDTHTPPAATQGHDGSADRPRLEPGARPLPDFVLVQKLGEGGFGEVWKARGPGDIDVAMKFIRLGDKAGKVELRALELIKGIRHPHLVGLFGAWRLEGDLILAMELADGTLLDRLNAAEERGQTGIPRAELLEYLREAAKGIDHLNSLNIQHQDVKPQNLLLVGGGVKVADFGLAKVLAHSVSVKSHGGMTLAFAPPEFHDGKTTQWSDQYSLAVSYCQLRGGRLPFEGGIAQVVSGHMLRPPDLTMLPEPERAAVARALAKEPKQRWDSCRAFVEALAGAGAGSPTRSATRRPAPGPVADTIPTRGVRPERPARRGRWVLLAGLLLLLGVGLLLFAPGRGQTTTRRSVWKDEEPGGTTGPLALDLGGGVMLGLAYIKQGEFWMGSSEDEPERNPFPEQKEPNAEKRHRVQISKPFWLGKYAVTQQQYTRLTGKPNPSHFSATGGGKDQVKGEDTTRFPVENVSWNDATAFCEELNRKHLSQVPEGLRQAGYRFRLPTEAQWEYACRAGTQTPFSFGKELNGKQANCDGTHPYGTPDKGPYLKRTCPVGFYDANAFGLFDMHGNVWQWCADYYDPNFDNISPIKDPFNDKKGAEGARVIRGGAWGRSAGLCRAAFRGWRDPVIRDYLDGFRVALRLD
jgi:formylglycine-generating enzyme required for sulfatase activity